MKSITIESKTSYSPNKRNVRYEANYSTKYINEEAPE